MNRFLFGFLASFLSANIAIADSTNLNIKEHNIRIIEYKNSIGKLCIIVISPAHTYQSTDSIAISCV